MIEKLKANIFLDKSKSTPVIDVRSPAEYKKGHIPGAFNIPLFSDEERAEIGTLYKQEGRESAVMRGLEIVGPKLAAFVQESKSLSSDNSVLVHCWRGGMRSESFVWLLETAGMNSFLLDGGYKEYRKFIRNEFLKAGNPLILGGMTGCGKTEILYELKKRGEQILDLEGLANHKGSAFGAIGQDDQPTNEQFENNSYFEWEKFDLKRRIWIEDESQKIGTVVINENLFKIMRQASLVKVAIPKNVRVERLVRDYCNADKNILKELVMRIKRRLGDQRAKEIIMDIEANNFENAINSILDYYDKGYAHGNNKRNKETVYELSIEKGDVTFCAESLLEFVEVQKL